jgi:hypothetical protein
MDADEVDVLNLLRGTTGLSKPAKVTIYDVTRHARNGRTYEIIVHVHELGPDSHPERFSAVASDRHDPARRVLLFKDVEIEKRELDAIGERLAALNDEHQNCSE